MKKFFSKKTFLLFCSLILASGISHSQTRGGGVAPTVALVPTITHGTCSDSTGNVSYNITVSTGWVKGTKINSLILKNESGTTVYSHQDGSISYGSVSNLPIGSYNFSGSVTVQNSSGQWISVLVNATIWIGTQTAWKDMVDMIASPNSYSTKRMSLSNPFGSAISKNSVSSGNYWVEMKSVLAGSSNSHVYWLIGNYQSLGGFNPNDDIQYIEFYNAGGSSGVRVHYMQSNGNFAYSNLSASLTDKIRIVRTGTTLRIHKNDINTLIFTFPVANTGSTNIAVASSLVNDGCLNVVSSMSCAVDYGFYYLKNEVEQSIGYTDGLSVKFKFEENYFDDIELLNYSITNLSNLSVNPQTGTLTRDFKVNWMEIQNNVNGISLSPGNTYLLEVSTSKGKKGFLKFTL